MSIPRNPERHARDIRRIVDRGPHSSFFSSYARKELSMKEHQFTLVLTAEPNEQEADELYGLFDDGTLCTIAGVPQIHFHRAALSLESVISNQ